MFGVALLRLFCLLFGFVDIVCVVLLILAVLFVVSCVLLCCVFVCFVCACVFDYVCTCVDIELFCLASCFCLVCFRAV